MSLTSPRLWFLVSQLEMFTAVWLIIICLLAAFAIVRRGWVTRNPLAGIMSHCTLLKYIFDIPYYLVARRQKDNDRQGDNVSMAS
jgi:hypothetical protein